MRRALSVQCECNARALSPRAGWPLYPPLALPPNPNRVLTLWPSCGEVQLFDSGPKKMFLKRSAPPEKITLPHLFLGATVVICARPYKVLDYADGQTRRVVGSARGSAVVLVLPEFYASAGQVLQLLQGEGIGIGRLRMVRFSEAEAAAFEALGGNAGGGGGGGGGGALADAAGASKGSTGGGAGGCSVHEEGLSA